MPTIKQKLAAKAVVGNGGNITKAMIEVGYSPNTANTPQKLTESDGWKELMKKHLADEKIAKVHGKWIDDEDGMVSLKAIDMSYKLKGSYAAEKSINLNLEATIDEEGIDLITEMLNGQMKQNVYQSASESGNGEVTDSLDSKIQD